MKKIIKQVKYYWHVVNSMQIELVIGDCINHDLRKELNQKLKAHKDKALLCKAN